eukprot:761756-Hanusia_phi.AAC.3
MPVQGWALRRTQRPLIGSSVTSAGEQPSPRGRGPGPLVQTPREVDHLLLHQCGSLAQKRLARGLKLNHVEATALIASVVLEFIRSAELDVSVSLTRCATFRDGKTCAELMDLGRKLLGRRQVGMFSTRTASWLKEQDRHNPAHELASTPSDMAFPILQVLEGVETLCHEVQVEGTFPDGTKLVTGVHIHIFQSCSSIPFVITNIVHSPITLEDGDLDLALYGSFLPKPALSAFDIPSKQFESASPGAVVPAKVRLVNNSSKMISFHGRARLFSTRTVRLQADTGERDARKFFQINFWAGRKSLSLRGGKLKAGV